MLKQLRVLSDSPAGVTMACPHASALFDLLWHSLAEVLGTAVAAMLLRRAAKRAELRCNELREVVIIRKDLGYHYALPPSWLRGPSPAFGDLVNELSRMLVVLTGPIVVDLLGRVPELSAWIAPAETGPVSTGFWHLPFSVDDVSSACDTGEPSVRP